MKQFTEFPRSGPEIKFEADRHRVIVTGTDKEVLEVFRKLYKQTRPSRTDAELNSTVGEAEIKLSENQKGFSDAYQIHLMQEKIWVFKDVWGDHGVAGRAVLIYGGNFLQNKAEEEATIARIKADMEAIGHKF